MDAEINDITRNEASSPRNPCNNQLLIHVSYTQQSESHVQLTKEYKWKSPQLCTLRLVYFLFSKQRFFEK